MIWRHATHKDNLPSIRAGGLLKLFSTGKRPAVWFHAPERTPWAILHVCKRHSWDWRDIVVIEVNLISSHLKATASEGVRYLTEDVTPHQFSAVLNIEDILEETKL